MEASPAPDLPHRPDAVEPPAAPRTTDAPIPSRDLLGDRSSVLIEHHGMVYALRATRSGKLILTK